MGVALFEYKGRKTGDFEAIIISEPNEKEYVNIYTAKIRNRKFLLYIKKSKKDDSNQKNEPDNNLEIGQTVIINANLNNPKKQSNYKGFDYDLYLKSKGISGIFEVKTLKKVEKRISPIQSIIISEKKFISRLRNNIKSIFEKNINEKNASFITAITIGDKSNLDASIIENFKRASLSHILAISGAHFSYIILSITIISKLLKRKRLSKLIIIFLTLFFIELTAATPSVVRAGVMCIIATMASLLKRKNDILTSLSISILVQIIINPYVIFDIGLILSYSGVIGIVLLYPFIKKYIKFQIIGITISANLILIPIMMYYFNTLSLSFIISNIFASILLGPILIISYISIIIRIKPIFIILNILVNIFIKISDTIAKFQFSSINITTPSIISIAMYYIIIYEIMIKNIISTKKHRQKIICISLVIIIISNINFQKFSDNLYINFIDVSQGDACLIRKNSKVILIDGGGANNQTNSYNVGKSVLMPYLLARKIKVIDYMIFSHFDNDHCQGLIYILENLKVRNILIGLQYEKYDNYKKMEEIAKNKKVTIYKLKGADTLELDKNLRLDVLWPIKSKLINENSINNNSLVLKLKYHDFSILFTGDIEKIAEEEINQIYKNDLKSTMIKIAHHGSKTSSIEEFMKNVSPQYALIGVGENNKFKHPSNETLETLQKLNVKVYRTDINGEISIKVTKRNLKITTKK